MGMTSNTTHSQHHDLKVGSSMILSMQKTLPMSRTACADLLLRGYLRIYHQNLFKMLPLPLIPILIDFLDPLLRWCLEQQSPKILVCSDAQSSLDENVNALILKKNDWRRVSISTKYIVHDLIVASPSTPYTICIRDDEHIGSNLNDISWLCLMISSNASLRSLSLSRCRFLCEFSRWHYLMQHILSEMATEKQFVDLSSVRVDGHAHFDDECFSLLLRVIAAKCPALTHLHLGRTEVSDESVKALVRFLEKGAHPLWSVNLEFCAKVSDEGLRVLMGYLRRHPTRKMYVRCTSHSGFGVHGQDRDQRLSVTMYPT